MFREEEAGAGCFSAPFKIEMKHPFTTISVRHGQEKGREFSLDLSLQNKP
jgi:hypothetical protein